MNRKSTNHVLSVKARWLLRPGIFLVAGCALGVAMAWLIIGVYEQKRRVAYFVDQQLIRIDVEVRRVPKGGVLLIGDSIARASGVTRLCGQPVFNAGVSSATAEDIAPHARLWESALKPVAIIVALGTNDARLGFDGTQTSFEAAIREIASDHVPIGFASVPAPEQNKGIAGRFSARAIESLNDRLTTIARRLRAPMSPPLSPTTMDGIHPDDSGNQQWLASLEKACPTTT